MYVHQSLHILGILSVHTWLDMFNCCFDWCMCTKICFPSHMHDKFANMAWYSKHLLFYFIHKMSKSTQILDQKDAL